MSATITIKIVDRNLKPLGEFPGVSSAETVESFKKTLIKNCEAIRKRKIGTERIRLTVGDSRGPALADKRKPLSEYLKGPTATVVFKDLGLQISWTTVFLVEYFGPILITGILALFQKQIYGREVRYTFNQKLGIAMVIGHYLKRELETIFVHRFSNDTMPILNIFKNCGHYWFIFGFINMYFFLHPDYTAPTWASDNCHIALAVLFGVFEFLNLMCHITLRNLRPPGSTVRGIPKGWGFGLVSCANYFWESLCWLTFAVSSQVIGAYIFFFVSTFQMLAWAFKKHSSYRKDFPDYPRGRKAMFPFVL
jgi:very-long-chain enoyl-CoA reductase